MEDHNVSPAVCTGRKVDVGSMKTWVSGLSLVLSRKMERAVRSLTDIYLVNQKDSMNVQHKKLIVWHNQIVTMNFRDPLTLSQGAMNPDICISF